MAEETNIVVSADTASPPPPGERNVGARVASVDRKSRAKSTVSTSTIEKKPRKASAPNIGTCGRYCPKNCAPKTPIFPNATVILRSGSPTNGRPGKDQSKSTN